MKNIIALSRPREIEQFVYGQLRTDRFRQSYRDPCGYMRHWVARFAQVPRFFCEMSVPRVEHPLFYPWLGGIALREYENPAVNDLFWLHEMAHAVTLEYDPASSFDVWFERIVANEISAAMESETMVYHELPLLRAETFAFPIWADRFLGPGKAPITRERLRIERRRAMADPDPADPVECEMASYPRQNRQWGEVWRHNYVQVETAMQRLVILSEDNRQSALVHHVNWLTQLTGMTEARPYPFPDEAEAFAEIFWRNKAAGATKATGCAEERVSNA